MNAAAWDFDYRPVYRSGRESCEAADFVIATFAEARTEDVARALWAGDDRGRVDPILVRPPLYWYRVRTESPTDLREVARALSSAGIGARYVTPTLDPSLALGARPDFSRSATTSERTWRRTTPSKVTEPVTAGHWFLAREAGVDVDRTICRTGVGMQLAVIDDEARDADALDLDAEVLVGVSAAPRGSAHGTLMAAWATSSRGDARKGIGPFVGVAPDAACRLYVIPRPGQGVLWVPLAIVRAVDDGADVVVCATYVENTTSPLLDDALEFAMRIGRNGLGAAVILPTGREISSPPGSVHSSLTLSFADPASDPRVLCVAPSGASGGWFFWTDKAGKKRPFANRGPAARLAAPGDDMAYPFAKDGRLGHAESSGASAIGAGVALLVLGKNPELRADELYGLLTSTARECPTDPGGPIGDPADLLPAARDPDGHDAKSGYGRVSALRACLAAADPLTATLINMGEEAAARRYLLLRETVRSVREAYSTNLAHWSARTLVRDEILAEGAAALCRHLRLLAGRVDRQEAHPPGATARALALLIDRLSVHPAPDDVAEELRALQRRARDATTLPAARQALEGALFTLAAELWARSADA